jgi:hypothetical protein
MVAESRALGNELPCRVQNYAPVLKPVGDSSQRNFKLINLVWVEGTTCELVIPPRLQIGQVQGCHLTCLLFENAAITLDYSPPVLAKTIRQNSAHKQRLPIVLLQSANQVVVVAQRVVFCFQGFRLVN